MLAKLRATGGNQSQAAAALGIPRTTLRDKMGAYGLESAAFKRLPVCSG
jgi:DNA-binding protein Fis